MSYARLQYHQPVVVPPQFVSAYPAAKSSRAQQATIPKDPSPPRRKRRAFHGIEDVFSNLWRRWGQRLQLLFFLAFGTGGAIFHHSLYQTLSGRPVASGGFRLGKSVFISEQALVSAGSNALSQLVKWSFVAAMGVTFSQVFWSTVEPYASARSRRRATYRELTSSKSWGVWNLKTIDAPVAAASGNPFLFSSVKTWTIAPRLAVIASAMIAMIFISTLAPGSIRVVDSEEYGVPAWCTIYVPDVGAVQMTNENEGGSPGRREPNPPSQRYYSLETHNAPPDEEVFRVPSGPRDGETWEAYTHRDNERLSLQQETDGERGATETSNAIMREVFFKWEYPQFPSPCGLCQYNMTFIGPSLECNEVDFIQTPDDSSAFEPTQERGTPLYLAVFDQTAENMFDIRYREWETSRPRRRIHCNAFAATYHIQVRHSSRVKIVVDSIERGARIRPDSSDPTIIQLSALLVKFGGAVRGLISSHDDRRSVELAGSSHLRYITNNIFGSSNGEAGLAQDPGTLFADFMASLSFSLLAGQFQPQGETYFAPIKKRCDTTQLVYDYDMWRLWGIYGAGWAVTMLSIVVGFICIARNGRERDMEFSHLVKGLKVEKEGGSWERSEG